MKILIILSLVVAILGLINDSPSPTWVGNFWTVLPCEGNCCCPVFNQTYYLVPLGQSVNMVGKFEDNSVCTQLGVSSATSTTPLPYGQNNAFSSGPAQGKNGQVFNNWFIVDNYPYLGPDGQIENVTLATIEINQTAIGGDESCFFRFIKTGIVDYDLEDILEN